ncbi:uroporphyrinogen-III C-methyltransferase [Rhodoblastus sp.]|jgi:uroporphyrin-III C-methyltransferase|uniref:uroporphyrinogen-III C-methyltransferase n=1 Tax=Rhodoblastus sp. TaxID=1962975 RepID=UPI0025E6DB96|nr:uroporphyrinogen-III C-methyltransferase [Rhodoblastus sp.]
MTNGVVYLVGAGPGAPDLLTLRALRIIETADVLVYDRLVSEPILALAPTGIPRLDVGKQPKCHPVPQDEINQLLVRLAARYARVVRLKGGDPLLFGRGGEEAAHLTQAGIACEIVPGVTAAQGAAAAIGIPLTQRGCASSLRHLTGHGRNDSDLDFDWRGLADPHTTLVVYMGLANIALIAERLLAQGRRPSTPVAAINNATLPSQRHLIARLDNIVEMAQAANFEGPVLFIIGEVAGLSLGSVSTRIESVRTVCHAI